MISKNPVQAQNSVTQVRAPNASAPAAVPPRANAPINKATAPQRASIAAGVQKAIGATIVIPKSVMFVNTNDLGAEWFRAMIYGETDSRKTVTAAKFGTPEEVRIILTRRKEQLRGLKKMGYQAAVVEDKAGLEALLLHPEAAWTDPTWVTNPNRTLILDDATEAINILLEGNEIINNVQVKNRMRTYDAAGKDLRQLLKRSFKAPQHIIATALAKVKENKITGNEMVMPDLPPAMGEMYKTELEYVFYIKKSTWQFYTSTKYETVMDRDENTGREEEFRREVFSKNKMPLIYKDAHILGQEEKMSLRDIWTRITNAETIAASRAK